ncbi:MAG: DUF5591 domain-containing protein [Euryarchaeota archaeon]|nr:DUF5591 domain-containing protein [Euryarchaeota archaeon]
MPKKFEIPEKDWDVIGINGVSEKQLTHPHFEAWHKWIISEYQPPKKKIAVFIPCAAIKPYFNSPIHKAFNSIIDKYDSHKIVISNAGVIPYEFSNCWPYNAYDWNPAFETKKIKKSYIEVTMKRIKNFLIKHSPKYKNYVAYLHPNSESLKALRKACAELNVPLNIVKVKKIRLHKTADRDLILAISVNLKKLEQVLEKLSKKIKAKESHYSSALI